MVFFCLLLVQTSFICKLICCLNKENSRMFLGEVSGVFGVVGTG